jgi:hypothetical protein
VGGAAVAVGLKMYLKRTYFFKIVSFFRITSEIVEIAILKKEQGNPEVHLFDLYPKGIFDELLKEVT